MAPHYPIDFDVDQFSLAARKRYLAQFSGEAMTPGGRDIARGHDRIWLPLTVEVPGKPLPVHDLFETLNGGREVFFMSAGGQWAEEGTFWFEPMI